MVEHLISVPLQHTQQRRFYGNLFRVIRNGPRMTLWIKIIVLGIGPAMPRFNILVNLYTYKGQLSFFTGVTGLNVVT